MSALQWAVEERRRKKTPNYHGQEKIIKAKTDESLAEASPPLRRVNPQRVKVSNGSLYIRSTYNNTLMTLTDKNGNALFAFQQREPWALSVPKRHAVRFYRKIAELLADKAINAGIKEVDVVVKRSGAGRGIGHKNLASKGIEIAPIKDVTPIPHNGPQAEKTKKECKKYDAR